MCWTGVPWACRWRARRRAGPRLYALRENSRTRMALAGAKVPTETLLLGQAADALQLLLWTKTKDAQHGRNRPAPLVPTLLGRVQECETAGFADGAAYEAARARILRSV